MNLRMVLPVEIAVIALIGATYYGYHAVRDEPQYTARTGATPTPTATPSPTPALESKRLVNKKGGFAVGVPKDVEAEKIGLGVTMTTADKVLSVVIAPVESGKLSVSSEAFLRGMKQSYTKVRVTSSDTRTIDGRRATATFGRARSSAKVDLHFLNLVVKAKPHNFSINVFTADGSDQMFILPRVETIIETFEVLP